MKKLLLVTFTLSLIIVASIFIINHKSNSTEDVSLDVITTEQTLILAKNAKQINVVLEEYRESLKRDEKNWHPVSPFSQ